jgi:hypothetical protein
MLPTESASSQSGRAVGPLFFTAHGDPYLIIEKGSSDREAPLSERKIFILQC